MPSKKFISLDTFDCASLCISHWSNKGAFKKNTSPRPVFAHPHPLPIYEWPLSNSRAKFKNIAAVKIIVIRNRGHKSNTQTISYPSLVKHFCVYFNIWEILPPPKQNGKSVKKLYITTHFSFTGSKMTENAENIIASLFDKLRKYVQQLYGTHTINVEASESDWWSFRNK